MHQPQGRSTLLNDNNPLLSNTMVNSQHDKSGEVAGNLLSFIENISHTSDSANLSKTGDDTAGQPKRQVSYGDVTFNSPVNQSKDQLPDGEDFS